VKNLLFLLLPKPGYAVEAGEKVVVPDSDEEPQEEEGDKDKEGNDSDSDSNFLPAQIIRGVDTLVLIHILYIFIHRL
jgi:hypothetical protein